VANWRGQQVLDTYKAEMMARGFPATREEYFNPPAVPAEDDMMQHPAMLKNLKDRKVSLKSRVEKKLDLRFAARKKTKFSLSKGIITDLAQWRPGEGKDSRDVADEILTLLHEERKEALTLTEALKRPTAVFPIEWKTATNGRKFPTVLYAEAVIETLPMFTLFLQLDLAAGDHHHIPQWIHAQLDFQKHSAKYSKSSYLAIFNKLTTLRISESIWQAGMQGALTEQDYQQLDLRLQDMDAGQVLHQSLHSIFMESAPRVENFRKKTAIREGWGSSPKEWWQRLRGLTVELRPPGLTAIRQVDAMREIRDYAMDAKGRPTHRFTLTDLRHFEEKEKRASIYKFNNDIYGTCQVAEQLDVDALHYQYMAIMIRSSLDAEAGVALTRAGIALERHRLKSGTYPADLAELGTDLPSDPYTGQSLHYRKNPDGTALIWACGIDAKDDGGKANDIPWYANPQIQPASNR